MMQRRHFELIAGVLRDFRRTSEPGGLAELATDELAERFADQLRKENPRFDRDRFIRACGGL